MIAEFLKSWDLFQNTYLAGWFIGGLLAMVGVLVVSRDQIFIGAAVSEASTLGIALGMWIASTQSMAALPWLGSDAFLSAISSLFSVLAALVTIRRGQPGEASHEAVTGWVFLAGGSLSILVVSHSPHGLEEVHRLLSSSIIGASSADVWMFAGLAMAVAAWILARRRALLLFLIDPEMAQAVGLRVRLWEGGIACLLGLTIGLSLRASGLLYTFGCLVLPGLAARNFCRSALTVFILSPLVAVLAGAAGFVLANHHDQPPGPMVVALLGPAAALSWLGKWLAGRS